MLFDLEKPCDNCPFRKKGGVRLHYSRAKEIGTADGSFPCHKTTVPSEFDDGDMVATPKSRHCAGFLIFREKQKNPSQMMRIAERLGLYNPEKFINSPLAEEVIDAYKEMEEL